MKRSLLEYVEAMVVVRDYEREMKPPEGAGAGICRCSHCGMKFGYNSESINRGVNSAGTSLYYGTCPYCDTETLLATR